MQVHVHMWDGEKKTNARLFVTQIGHSKFCRNKSKVYLDWIEGLSVKKDYPIKSTREQAIFWNWHYGTVV